MTRFVSQPANLGHGFSVEFSFRPGGLFCEWSPAVPNSETPARVLMRYLKARDAFIAARILRRVGDTGPVHTELSW